MAPQRLNQSNRPFWRILRWIGRIVALASLLLLLAGLALWFSTPLPTPERLRANAAIGSTRILDRNGQLLFAAPDPLSGWRRPLPLDEIPLTLRQATIAIEDRGFYSNVGIDLRGIARAAWLNLRSGAIVAGGSTITQQLARNFLLEPHQAQQRVWSRKLREAVLALKLTANYEKDEILALYLNQTYYGGMSYGVEAAAQHFFGKPARDLDLAESALLAGLPQAPSHYDPLNDPAAAQARQAFVLDAMLQQGYIDAEQHAAALAEPLQYANNDATMRAPHFVTYVLGLLEAEFGPDTLARGGLTITTTLDADLNDAAQRSLRRHLAQLADPHNGEPDHLARNGAVLVLEPSNGAILAMVGSPDFDNRAIQGQVNAVLARRQPGSAIKPLTYAAALERGWTPASILFDVPSNFVTNEGQPYSPQNYDSTFHGPLLLREALATSSNVAAVNLLDQIGIPALLDMAERLGIASLLENSGRYGLAITLGGGEVTLLELTSAYASFANQGQRVHPTAILAISDANGQPIALPEAPPSTTVLSADIAYLISDILSDRYARSRAFGLGGPLEIDRPAAVKTGTSTDWRDNWTLGYTPDRAVGVWVGNADGSPMRDVTGISGAGPVWHEVMLLAHRGIAPKPFERPNTIVETTICAASGLLPGPYCSGTRQERFIEGTQPTRPDDTHIPVYIDPRRDCRTPAGYPPEHTILRIYRVLPPQAEAWAHEQGLPQIPREICPPLAAETSGNSAPKPSAVPMPSTALAPAVLSPASGAHYVYSADLPPERQRIRLRAQAGIGARRLTIYLNEQPLAQFTAPPYETFWTITPGTYRLVIEIEDENGQLHRSAETHFSVSGQQTN